MTQYKFRGKRKDNNEWVYGFYVSTPSLPLADSKHLIVEFAGIESGEPIFDWNEVIPETVGMWSGWNDKNGNPIYEGDNLRGIMGEQDRDNGSGRTDTVFFATGGFEVFAKPMRDGRGIGKGVLDCFMWCDPGSHGCRDQYWQIDNIEIIGNIHEVNPASGKAGDNYMFDPNQQQQEAAGQAEATNEQAAEGQKAATESAAQDAAVGATDSEEGSTEG